MSIRFGVSPIAWINDDLPALGGDTPLDSVLADARDVGFAGIELGGKFPKDANVLRALLNRHQLALVGGWYSASLLTRSAAAEIHALQSHLGLLKALGCSVFILAETSNAIHCDQGRADVGDTAARRFRLGCVWEKIDRGRRLLGRCRGCAWLTTITLVPWWNRSGI